jgi:monooxygenase
MKTEHLDVVIVGAGISGIGAAAHLTRQQPQKSYVILEAREAIGGTWDLFRYPGIRSDSDLHTFCYEFKPWLEEKSIADGESILNYVSETASEHGIDEHIRFEHRVVEARWSTENALWTVVAERGPARERTELTATWLFCAGGYYDYDSAYLPELEGMERFQGEVIHPQFWPEDLDYAGKRVVVIGSGATAMTIVPAMADKAAHVTLLQRTPTYVVGVPAVDPLEARLKGLLGPVRAHRAARWKNVRLQRLVWNLSKRRPNLVRKLIRAGALKSLPAGFAVDTHFNPPYNPWDQRMCVVPDGDLFRSIRQGQVSIVTDQVETFTEHGIRLQSGDELAADIVVTATGLKLLALGGVNYKIDAQPIRLSDQVTYKGMMLTGMPNFLYAVGYINASWTLKVDLICEHFCRLLSLMDEHDYAYCVPDAPDPDTPTRPLLDFGAGYVLRSVHEFPRQGSEPPWELNMDYLRDRKLLLEGPVGDHLQFVRRAAVDGESQPGGEPALAQRAAAG